MWADVMNDSILVQDNVTCLINRRVWDNVEPVTPRRGGLLTGVVCDLPGRRGSWNSASTQACVSLVGSLFVYRKSQRLGSIHKAYVESPSVLVLGSNFGNTQDKSKHVKMLWTHPNSRFAWGPISWHRRTPYKQLWVLEGVSTICDSHCHEILIIWVAFGPRGSWVGLEATADSLGR